MIFLDWDPTFPRYKMMSATGPKGLILHVSGSGSGIRIDYIMNNISRYIEDLVIGDTKYIIGASGKPRVVSTSLTAECPLGEGRGEGRVGDGHYMYKQHQDATSTKEQCLFLAR